MRKWSALGTTTDAKTPSGRTVKVADVKAINSGRRKDQQQKAAAKKARR